MGAKKKAAVEDLRGEENCVPPQYWDNILASIEEGVIVINHQRTVVFFNHAAEDLTGQSRSQVLSQPHSRVFSANPWITATIDKIFSLGLSSVASEGHLSSRERSLPVRLAVSPLLDGAGSLLGAVVVLHDLTYQEELEEQVRRADRLAYLGTLAAGLAHEIKNPLAGIKGAAQLIQGRTAGDIRKYTEVMVREIDRLSGLLDHLLQLGSHPALELKPVNVHKVIRDVLLLERETLGDSGITVKTLFDPSLPCVMGDEAELSRVFRNLIKNALQALSGKEAGLLTITSRMETDFRIRHSVDQRGKFLSVEIEDNGPGIPEEHLHKLFAPFFTTKSGGTGLGLTICQQIVTQHEGMIQVESRPGEGTTFKVLLPLAKIEADS